MICDYNSFFYCCCKSIVLANMCVSPKSVKMMPWMKNHTKVDNYSLPSIEGGVGGGAV